MANTKQTLRKQIIAQRLELPQSTAKEAAIKLAKHLLEVVPNYVNVAGYSTIRGEIDVAIALAELAYRGNKTALPVVIDNTKILKFLEYTPNAPLIAGNFSIPTPPPHLPEVIPDVLIVPMVGFDDKGNRIGYGGGYYDATIRKLRASNPKLLVIGVAYNFQKLENTTFAIHDEKMDMVVTENGVVK